MSKTWCLPLLACALFLFTIRFAAAAEDPDFARYRDFGHISGLIGNYLSRPKGPLSMESLGEYRLTFYWITRARASDGPATSQIHIRCPETGEEDDVMVSPLFKKRLDREGTGFLEDGRLINVLKRGEKKHYLDISMSYPTGLGSANNPLTPFISVAVSDRNPDLKFGNRIFIPDVKGTPLPDGGTHDGFFRVDDTGKGIAANQIDVFIFVRSNWSNFEWHWKAHSRTFFVYKIYQRKR